MGDNLERTNGVAERPWSSFEFHGNVACKNAKRRVEIAGEFTALLLHFFVSALKSMERVKRIEPS